MLQTERSGPLAKGRPNISSINREQHNPPDLQMPRAWHEQTEWEIAAAYADGFAAGMAAYDRELAQALTQALGGPNCTDRREAVRIHQRAADQRRRRLDSDNRGPLPGDYRGGPVEWEQA